MFFPFLNSRVGHQRTTAIHRSRPAMKLVPIVWVVIFALVLSACEMTIDTQRASERALSYSPWLIRWMQSPACQPPCWEGITPGVTSSAQALSTLENIPDTRITYRINSRLEWAMDRFDGGAITTENGIVNSIRLRLNSNEVLTLSQLDGRYGEPSEVRINRCVDTYCELDLTYPSQRMVLEMLLPHGGYLDHGYHYRVQISAYASVGRISLFKDMSTYLALSPTDGASTFVKWKGPGLYP